MFTQQYEGSSSRASPGCSNCRYAKKGCDQRKPTCGRCLRLSQTCYGYRRNTSVDTSEDVMSSSTGRVVLTEAGDWAQLAKHYADHELIRDLVSACGLIPTTNASTSVQPSSAQAADLYGHALSTVRGALQHPHQVANDTVLLIMLLLYVFERFQWHGKASSPSWILHIRGIVDLVQARGLRQLRTKIGRAIFRTAREILLDVAFSKHIAPPYFLILGSQAMRQDHAHQFRDQLAVLETRTAVLRGRLHDNDLGQGFFQAAHVLQQDIAYWQKTVARSRLETGESSFNHCPLVVDINDHRYISWLESCWPVVKLHICRLAVSRVQSGVFRKLWQTSAPNCEDVQPCCQECPISATTNLIESVEDVVDLIRRVPLPFSPSTVTLGIYGAISLAADCLEEELDELTPASCSMLDDAQRSRPWLESLRSASQWLSAARLSLQKGSTEICIRSPRSSYSSPSSSASSPWS